MTYAADNSVDFRSVARQLRDARAKISGSPVAHAGRSDGSELIPTDAQSRMQREGSAFRRRPSALGATVDREGLNNAYAVEPPTYFASFPSSEQARRYALQAGFAALFVASLLVTAFVVS